MIFGTCLVRLFLRFLLYSQYYVCDVPTEDVFFCFSNYFFRPFGGSLAGEVRPVLPAPTGGAGPVGVVVLLNLTNLGKAMTNYAAMWAKIVSYALTFTGYGYYSA